MNRSTALFDRLSSRQIAKIVASGPVVKYSDGQLIHSRGDNKPGLSIVKSGSASVGVYGVDGHFVMASVLGPGECFGEFTIFTELPRTHDISAAGDSEIYQIPARRFQALCEEDPSIVKALLSITLQRTHLLLEMLDAIRRLPLLERTAKTLLTMAATSGSKTKVQCKQADLAYHLGVTRVSLGKALKQLVELGLIEIGYGEVRFNDISHLGHWVEAHCNTTPLER